MGAIIVTLGIGTCSTNARIDDGFASVNQRIDDTNRRMGDGFASVNRRTDDTNQRIDDTNRRVDEVQSDIREIRTLLYRDPEGPQPPPTEPH